LLGQFGSVTALMVAGLAGPAGAQDAPQPPEWALLAECSAVFAAAGNADQGYVGEGALNQDRADLASARFLEQAVRAAGSAGQADPEGAVESIMDYLTPRWADRADSLFAVPSNLRWFSFCGRLGRDTGILPLPD
jgi:hypothetical protein